MHSQVEEDCFWGSAEVPEAPLLLLTSMHKAHQSAVTESRCPRWSIPDLCPNSWGQVQPPCGLRELKIGLFQQTSAQVQRACMVPRG